MKCAPIFATVALGVLIGTITDKTTGQPLEGITVSTTAGSHTVQAHTDAAGRFVLRNIGEGSYTLRMSSRDVPAQTAKIQVRGASTHVSLKACSMTLDYSCEDGGGPGGG